MMARFGSLELLSKITRTKSTSRQYIKALIVLSAYFFLVLSLARPQWGTKLEITARKGVDIVVAMDVSESMLAQDIKPDRLERAKHEVSQFIAALQGDRIGLVAFAGDAFLQCPLTLDYGAAKMFLDVMDPNLIPIPGTAISQAISASRKAFKVEEKKYKVLILITDGEDHEGNAVEEAEKAAKEGIVIYTLGIGSDAGVPIPVHDASGNVNYKKDREGNVVMTRVDVASLERIALVTNGKAYQSTSGGLELERIYKEIRKMEKREMESKHFTQFEDRYQWPLGIALILLILEYFVSERQRKKLRWDGRFA
jgi:Ca-activated chloride channel family protein